MNKMNLQLKKKKIHFWLWKINLCNLPLQFTSLSIKIIIFKQINFIYKFH